MTTTMIPRHAQIMHGPTVRRLQSALFGEAPEDRPELVFTVDAGEQVVRKVPVSIRIQSVGIIDPAQETWEIVGTANGMPYKLTYSTRTKLGQLRTI